MVETLYWSSEQVKTYTLSNGEKIVIGDRDMVLEMLSGFDDKKNSKILSYVDQRLASEIFTKLALPNLD